MTNKVLALSGVVPRLLGGAGAPGPATAVADPARATAQAAQGMQATRSAQIKADAVLGWVWTGPAAAETLAFASSVPAVAYTCGVPDNPGGVGRIVVWASPDGGATWAERPTPARDQYCSVIVNPTDARDVALWTTSDVAVAGGGSPSAWLYRSFDGGASWRAFPLPPRVAGDAVPPGGYAWAWVGDTLYVAPSYASDNGIYRLLAASAGGAPLHWLDTRVLFAAEAGNASLRGLAAAGGSLVVQMVRPMPACEKARTAASADCSPRLWRTRAGGATWARFAAAVDGHALFRLDGQPDGAALFVGYYATPDGSEERYARSIDEGATWTALPPPPLGQYLSDLVQAPDGDVYAAVTDSGGVEMEIYALPANNRAWRLVAPFPEGGGGPLIVSWDARGQPAALWTNASAPTESAPVALGLVRHTP